MAWMSYGKNKPKKSKYGSHRAVVDGITFDSKAEAKRWTELRILEKAGAITDLKRQVKYVLIPACYEESEEVYKRGKNKGQKKKGKIIEYECSYIADFTYHIPDCSKEVVEDVKGYRGGGAYEVFKIKRKLMLQIYGIRIREVH